ncbi:hypothetical protein [Thiohalorhabdus sp.]|uniref:hypothetical protein n=1 Tax=Thiohalorhabdus sp. TaxID=3094134 RepID=UPI002FC36CEF
MTVTRRPFLTATDPNSLLGLLAREELAFRCVRDRLAVRRSGPAQGLSVILADFLEPGRNQSDA